MSATASKCRQRKVICPDCGYTIRMTRSWMQVGLPSCCCGGEMRPDSPADLAYCGLITSADMPAPLWTLICRENGWDDSIQRRGGAAKNHEAKYAASGGLLGRSAGKPHCGYAGCGRWVAAGSERCSEHAHELEAMPF